MIKITPTFSGCPAMHVIEDEVEACVHGLGAHHVRIELYFHRPGAVIGYRMRRDNRLRNLESLHRANTAIVLN